MSGSLVMRRGGGSWETPAGVPESHGEYGPPLVKESALLTQEPGPIRKIPTHLGEPLEPPPLAPARGPPTDWGELGQTHDDRAIFQASPDELQVIDIHSL